MNGDDNTTAASRPRATQWSDERVTVAREIHGRSRCSVSKVPLVHARSGNITGPPSDRWSNRWIVAAVWLVLFGLVAFATAWLATVALVAAFCWVVRREWLRAPDPSIRT